MDAIVFAKAAYLTEIEITRRLNLPDKVGRIMMAMWKMNPSFPKDEPGSGGRRWFSAVVRWLQHYHGVEGGGWWSSAGDTRDQTNFDEWRAGRKARRSKLSKGPGLDLPPPPKPGPR
jgi:hypothetical protein